MDLITFDRVDKTFRQGLQQKTIILENISFQILHFIVAARVEVENEAFLARLDHGHRSLATQPYMAS